MKNRLCFTYVDVDRARGWGVEKNTTQRVRTVLIQQWQKSADTINPTLHKASDKLRVKSKCWLKLNIGAETPKSDVEVLLVCGSEYQRSGQTTSTCVVVLCKKTRERPKVTFNCFALNSFLLCFRRLLLRGPRFECLKCFDERSWDRWLSSNTVKAESLEAVTQ